MNDFKKLGIPLLVVFLGALCVKLIESYPGSEGVLLKIVAVAFLCVFGYTLNASHGKSRSVWKKVTAILCVIFLLFMQLNLFVFSSISHIFSILGMNAFYINMLYIFFGYLFAD